MLRKIAAVLLVTVTALAAGAQQPREQGPPPADCAQAMRENAAMRERIASLERQIDAVNEEAKTFYIRSAHLEQALADERRLANGRRLADERLLSDERRLTAYYREELAIVRDRLDRLDRAARRKARR
jgi:small-conductance mechanosensitive channel